MRLKEKVAHVSVAVLVLLAGCSGVALPQDSVEDGEQYSVTFQFEGDCPTGTEMWISPTDEGNDTVRFWRVEAGEYSFEAVGNKTYDLKLVRPEMNNSTTTWTATTYEVVFKSTDGGACAFDRSGK